MPAVPFLSEVKWAVKGKLDDRIKQAARPVHQHYCLKDRRGVAVCFLRYKRLGPKALLWLRKHALERKKRRCAGSRLPYCRAMQRALM
jgi:hypothetical protein